MQHSEENLIYNQTFREFYILKLIEQFPTLERSEETENAIFNLEGNWINLIVM